MSSIETPPTVACSFSEGTPHLTINREATIDLDSSTAFEGPEKLLEVWFAPAAESLPIGTKKDGLKAVTADTWKTMLDQVNCKVLSVVQSEHVDAYLLSESSFFVFPHKLILKTCGTTTLLLGLRRMLRIAAVEAGFPSHISTLPDSIKTAATPYRVFYSRKNFLFPEKQIGPHKSWKDEVKFLDDMFTGGSAYMVGKMNGDHWYLYITTPNMSLTPPRTPDSERVETQTKILKLPASSVATVPGGSCNDIGTDDETLEILMTDLEPENAKQFYLEHASAVAEDKYAKRAHQARNTATESLGTLKDVTNTMEDLSLSGTTVGSSVALDETFDVFSNTSSDNCSAAVEVATFPEELTTEGHALGTVVSEACGLSDVYPTSRYADARVDAYLFTPCGFSANGVIPAPNGTATHYFTVHVTPEPQCSYASFETNVPGQQSGRETADIIQQVVGIFKPGRFSVTLFEAKASSIDAIESKLREAAAAIGNAALEVKGVGVVDGKLADVLSRGARMEHIQGYRRTERIVHDFDGYDLVFRQYERDDWEGGEGDLRVGEPDI